MSVDREDLIVAVDAVIASMLTLRKLLEQPGELDEQPVELDPWQEECPEREGKPHRVEWVRGAFTPEGVEQGVCHACGAEFERPAPTDAVGVSGPEEGEEQP